MAVRLFVCKQPVLVVEHIGKIDLDPMQLCGKIQSPGSRIQSTANTQHCSGSIAGQDSG